MLRVGSIKDVSFAFPYDVNIEGIASVVAADLADMMVLEFSEDVGGEYQLDVEIWGRRWSQACYRT